jgi:hypothetical protein
VRLRGGSDFAQHGANVNGLAVIHYGLGAECARFRAQLNL